MEKELAFSGQWWIPEHPENKIGGELEITPDGAIRLKIQGNLRGSPNWGTESNRSLVVGLSDTGKRITLRDCRIFETVFGHDDVLSSTLDVGEAFVGFHFESRENIKFKRVRAHYANLAEWINRHDFEIDFGEIDKNRLTVRYEQPNPVRARVGGYEIVVGNKGPLFSEDRFRKVEIEQKAWVEISCDSEKPFDDYVTVLQYIQNFLSLALSHPIYPLIIEAYSDQNKLHTKDGSEFEIPIEIHYRVPFMQYSEGKEFRYYNSLFTLSSVQENFELYMTNWINKVELFQPVYTLYFSTLHNPHVYLESQFLTLTQAIETYHRRRYDGKYQTDEDYRAGLYQVFVNAIPEGLDESFKMSLVTGKLKYANEFSLRTRLGKIMKKIFADLHIRFSNPQYQQEAFRDQVIDTRNYLTHYTDDLKTKAAHGKDLYELIRRLKALLEFCLLEEIGFTATSMREIALASPKYTGLFESV